MNFTKQQRKRLVDHYDPTSLINKLIEDCDELEKELEASRDSRILSAVPSEEEIEKHAESFILEKQKIALSSDRNTGWEYGDVVEAYVEGAKLIKRGIAG